MPARCGAARSSTGGAIGVISTALPGYLDVIRPAPRAHAAR